MAMKLSSPAFGHDEKIPLRYTGDGEDLSPPLSWSEAPGGAVELAVICDDPDAPTQEPWVHWVVYAIAPDAGGLPEGLPAQAELPPPVRARHGLNTWGKLGYGGPAPPRGHGLHHYNFDLYALDAALDLEPGATKSVLLGAMEGHILEKTRLTGVYQR